MEKDQTEGIRGRYDRISSYYDVMELILETLAFSRWRREVFAFLYGCVIVEVGVGTGKNFNFYPTGKLVTAIDFSPRMLSRAQRKARRKGVRVDLADMDVQNLQFGDQAFDTVFVTFVFCSVPDPIRGLREIKRVCKKGGRIVLLEHVRPKGTLLGKVVDVLNPITFTLMGVNINRDIPADIEVGGLTVLEERNLFRDIVKLIVASP